MQHGEGMERQENDCPIHSLKIVLKAFASIFNSYVRDQFNVTM
jgi:hypothetical protein